MASHRQYFEECKITRCQKQLDSGISTCSCQENGKYVCENATEMTAEAKYKIIKMNTMQLESTSTHAHMHTATSA